MALSKLSVEKRVPIGFVPTSPEKFVYHVNIAVSDAKLREVLDMLVRQEPDYTWEVRDGVVNIMPAGRRDQVIENLLSTAVSSFEPA